LSQALLPAIQQGLEKSGRERAAVKVTVTAFAVTALEEDLFVRAQIAFYASTPSYRAVMDLHGWGEVAEKLSGMARFGQWGEMATQINDEMLNTFAVVASAADLPAALRQRYGGVADRLGLYLPFTPGERDEFWKMVIAAIKG
jgi:predicted AAA+ superfamily ATPase